MNGEDEEHRGADGSQEPRGPDRDDGKIPKQHITCDASGETKHEREHNYPDDVETGRPRLPPDQRSLECSNSHGRGGSQ